MNGPLDGFGEPIDVAGCQQDSRRRFCLGSVADRFRNPSDLRRDGDHAHGHGFEQHGGEAVGVAVGADDAGRGHHVGPSKEIANFRLAARSEELDGVFEAERGLLREEFVGEFAAASDLDFDVEPLIEHLSSCVEQDAEALLLNQTPDCRDAQRPFDDAGFAEREPLEVEAVAHEVEIDVRKLLREEVVVVLADRHDGVGSGEELAQEVVIHRFMEDVLRMRRDGEGDPSEVCCDGRDSCRCVREMCMEVCDAVLLHPACEVEALSQVSRVDVVDHRHDGVQLPDRPGQMGVDRLDRREQFGGFRGTLQVDERRLHLRDFGMEACVGRGPGGVDGEVLPRCLSGQDLGDDESLGEPWVDLDDVAGAAHASPPSNLAASWPTSSSAAMRPTRCSPSRSSIDRSTSRSTASAIHSAMRIGVASSIGSVSAAPISARPCARMTCSIRGTLRGTSS